MSVSGIKIESLATSVSFTEDSLCVALDLKQANASGVCLFKV